MAMVIRGNRAYEYKSVRRGGRVTSEYVGGSIPAESAALFRSMEAAQRSRQEMARADWEAERRRLDEGERRATEVDEAYDELATVAMLATGHHRPQRGRWRRRRPMANKNQAKSSGPPPATAAEMGALLDRVDRAEAEGEDKKPHQQAAWDAAQAIMRAAQAGDERAMPALRALMDRRPSFASSRPIGDVAIREVAKLWSPDGDLFNRECIARQIAAMRDELAGPGASALERMLAERVALAWFAAHHGDVAAVSAELDGVSLARGDYLSRQRSRANARFLAAAKALATVRRLAMPVLHVHRDEAPPAPVASAERLRVLADGSN